MFKLSFPGVQSAAVNVICELARRNPKNYLSLAPLFFKLMTSSTNNWVLIKIIKLVRWRCLLENKVIVCWCPVLEWNFLVLVWRSHSVGASFGEEADWAPDKPHPQVTVIQKHSKALELAENIRVKHNISFFLSCLLSQYLGHVASLWVCQHGHSRSVLFGAVTRGCARAHIS